MVDSTDDRTGREWQESGHTRVGAVTPEVRADAAWQAFIAHITEECESTCRTGGVDCAEAVKLKAEWAAAKNAA